MIWLRYCVVWDYILNWLQPIEELRKLFLDLPSEEAFKKEKAQRAFRVADDIRKRS